VVPEEREGKTDDDPWLARDAAAPATAAVATRKGGFERPVQRKVCKAFVCLCLLNVQLISRSSVKIAVSVYEKIFGSKYVA